MFVRIGIDARPLQAETQYRGIGKSLEFFLHGLVKILSNDDTCVFYVDKALPIHNVLGLFPEARTIPIATSRLGRTRYIRSVLPSYPPIKPKKSEIDVLLQYDVNMGVPPNIPSVVVFYDMIPLLFRGQEKRQPAKGLRKAKNNLAGQMYWQKYLRSLQQYRKATKIIAISESSKNDLLKYVPDIIANRVSVIHLGVPELQIVDAPVSPRIKKIAQSPYILYVGGIDLRKNIVGLLKSFYEVKKKRSDLKLVAVGKEFGLEDQLQNLGWYEILNLEPTFIKDIVFPGFISGEELHYLYEHSAAFVLPSRYEGFGLPVLEAMKAGCPVIAYSNSSIPEVAGDAAMLVSDGKPLAPAIMQLLEDRQLRKKLVEKGYKQAALFTWEKTAQKTLDALKTVARS